MNTNESNDRRVLDERTRRGTLRILRRHASADAILRDMTGIGLFEAQDMEFGLAIRSLPVRSSLQRLAQKRKRSQ